MFKDLKFKGHWRNDFIFPDLNNFTPYTLSCKQKQWKSITGIRTIITTIVLH